MTAPGWQFRRRNTVGELEAIYFETILSAKADPATKAIADIFRSAIPVVRDGAIL